MSLSRRAVLGGALGLGASGCFRLARPGAPERPLSEEARSLWLRAWKDLDARQVLDAHVHVVGLGKGGTGCWVNPHMQQTMAHPILAARFSIYKAAAGVEDEEQGDAQYVATLTRRRAVNWSAVGTCCWRSISATTSTECRSRSTRSSTHPTTTS